MLGPIAQYWMHIDASERSQWAELARDIRNAYTQLVTIFGDGVIFDANIWEEEQNYRINSIFLKWLGAQTIQRRQETKHCFVPRASGESSQMIRIRHTNQPGRHSSSYT
ncbi:hypothetical protein CPB86DRAFT_785929 [Serendipita vermifera]|nr:hypothetical protein CPB86DRAFT_785929 [Serendipita vermifera]